MARKPDPDESEVLAAFDIVQRYLHANVDENGPSQKECQEAQRTINRMIRAREREVTAEKKRLKDAGIDVDKEIRRLLKGGA